MDDFLHKLRNSSKRSDQNTRKHNPRQGNGFERKSGNARRSGGYNKIINDQFLDLVDKILPDLKNFLEENTRHKKFMLELEEQRINIEEKKAQSIQSIAASMTSMADEKSG